MPVQAYRSGNTSIIGVKQKKSLLDRNYIFDDLDLKPKQAAPQRKVDLKSFSELVPAATPIQNKIKAESIHLKQKPILKPRKHTALSVKSNSKVKPFDSDGAWNSFQAEAELDEELNVNAKIVGL